MLTEHRTLLAALGDASLPVRQQALIGTRGDLLD
jgi:hypothetical protein